MSEELIEKLLDQLRKSEANIVFTKKDGSERTMRCTLNPATIPLEKHPKGKTEQNPNVVAVYDLENEGWRSFIKENLISFSVTL
jgi:hypothetical protein